MNMKMDEQQTNNGKGQAGKKPDLQSTANHGDDDLLSMQSSARMRTSRGGDPDETQY